MFKTNFYTNQVKQNPAFARLKSVESGFVGSQGFDSRDDLVSWSALHVALL